MCKKVPASVAILNGAKYLAYDYARYFASLRMYKSNATFYK